MDDEADAVLRVLDELLRVVIGSIVAVAGTLEDRGAVEPVADGVRADPQRLMHPIRHAAHHAGRPR